MVLFGSTPQTHTVLNATGARATKKADTCGDGMWGGGGCPITVAN